MAALVQNDGALREWSSTDSPKASRRNCDELRIRHVQHIAVVPENGEIGAARNVLRVLLFFDLVTCDAYDVIVFECQLHGFVERNAAERGRIAFLRDERASVKKQQDSEKERGAYVHHFSSRGVGASPSGKPSSP